MRDELTLQQRCPADLALERHAERTGETSAPTEQVSEDADREMEKHLAVCARCRARVEAIREDNNLLSEFAVAARPKPAGVAGIPALSSIQIPGYEIISESQRGGQGVVFEAIQLATKRTVALKVLLKGTFASVRQKQRFEREIDLIAGLQHPNIVTIYDSGQSEEGCHFYAMEFIEGTSLDRYVHSLRERHGGDEDAFIQDALRLFMTICNALNHAHQRGVIHRDLKPGNIRVDENGKPHVLDFGLAKLADSESAEQASLRTLTGEFMGTLSYASPEQTQGDPRQIDIRTDVYSLGVILYQMLTDHLPYTVGGAMADALRAIAVEDPAPPSIWQKRDHAEGKVPSRSACRINKELETIILKALTKEKDRRYQTAERLKADLSHYLEGEPIDAKRDSSWYVFQKTVRRHRAPVSVAAVVLLMVTVSIVYMVRQSEAAAELRGKWSDAKRMILNMIERHDPYKSKHVDATAIAVLDSYADELYRQPPADPLEQAVIRCALGKAYREHGLYEKAGPQLKEALSIREASSEVSQAEIAETRQELAAWYWKTGDYEAAEPLYEGALEIRESLYGGDHHEVAESLNHLAAVRHRQGRFADALKGYRAALEMRRSLEGDRGERVGWSLNNVATCLLDMGRFEEAETTYRQSLAIHLEYVAEDHLFVSFVLTGLGRCLARMGRYAEAEDALLQALAIKRKQANPVHPTVAITLCALAELRFDRGEAEEAEQLCREALEMQRRGLPGYEHHRIAASLLLLGRILEAQGDVEAAEAALHEALEIRERIGHFLTAEGQGSEVRD